MSCPHPVITHKVTDSRPGHRVLVLYECPDPECDADAGEHCQQLPCRWSWPYAHGKAHSGQPFPKRRCPGCYHIRRAGQPEHETGSQAG